MARYKLGKHYYKPNDKGAWLYAIRETKGNALVVTVNHLNSFNKHIPMNEVAQIILNALNGKRA